MQSVSIAKAETVYHRLLSGTDVARKRENVKIVWSTLLEMRDAGEVDFTLASVGRRVAKSGGPRTQSLRNKGGQEYRELIEVFAECVGGRALPNRRALSDLDQEIARISNLAVRHALKIMLEERKRLSVENDMLRAAFASLSVDTVRSSEHVENASVERVDSSQPSLSLEIGRATANAFTLFLTPDWLEPRGLRVEEDGSVVQSWASDIIVAPPGFVDGLRSCIRAFEGR